MSDAIEPHRAPQHIQYNTFFWPCKVLFSKKWEECIDFSLFYKKFLWSFYRMPIAIEAFICYNLVRKEVQSNGQLTQGNEQSGAANGCVIASQSGQGMRERPARWRNGEEIRRTNTNQTKTIETNRDRTSRADAIGDPEPRRQTIPRRCSTEYRYVRETW